VAVLSNNLIEGDVIGKRLVVAEDYAMAVIEASKAAVISSFKLVIIIIIVITTTLIAKARKLEDIMKT